jgi:hypothetical protein
VPPVPPAPVEPLSTFKRAVATGAACVGELLVTADASMVAAWVTLADVPPVLPLT